MKKILLIGVVLLSVFLAASASSAPMTAPVAAPLPAANTIAWQPYSASMFDDAKNKHHMVVLFAQSKVCRWCKKMEETTLSNAGIIKLVNNNFYPVMLDVDTNSDVADKFQIEDLPTILVFNSDGKVIKLLAGYIKPEDMAKNLEDVLMAYPQQ